MRVPPSLEPSADALLDGLSEALFVATVDGSIIYRNQAAGKLLESIPREILQRSVGELFTASGQDDPGEQRIREAFQKSSRIGGDVVRAVGCGALSGILVSFRGIHQAVGPVHFVAIQLAQDSPVDHLREPRIGEARTTALIEDGADHRRSEARYGNLFESAPDAMVISDRHGRIILVNAQTEKLFGHRRSEVIGQLVEVLVPVRFRQRDASLRDGFSADPKACAMGPGLDLLGLRKDGSEFAIEINLSPLENGDGLLISNAIRDVTERKSSDDQRAQLAAIVLSSTDAIIGQTLDGLISSWNNGAAHLYGYVASEVIGVSTSLLVPPDRLGEDDRLLARLLKNERVQPFETVRCHKDGRLLHVSVALSVIRDAAGVITGTSKVARDITAKKIAEAAMARAKEAAETASREFEAFSYSVAHDLRAPLRSIDGFSQALLEDYADKLDATGVDYLRMSRESAQHMARLIDDLLSLARVTRGVLNRGRVDMTALARAVAARLRLAQPDRQVEWVIADGIEAQGDPRLLGIVFDNLFGNAWKFTAKRDRARIEFGCQRSGSRSTYFIRDDGAGFNMEYSEKLFGVFQRLHATSEFEGTGIGLVTVQRIIHRHDGQIWAEGRVDHGATFFFTLNDQVAT